MRKVIEKRRHYKQNMERTIIAVPKAGEENEIVKLFEITIKAAYEEQGVGHLTESIADDVKTKRDMQIP